MGKQELSGYSFPRVPDRWAEDGRQFALGLRGLFDTLFGEQANISREIIRNSTTLSETITKMGKDFGASFENLTKSIAEAGQRFDEDARRMERTENRFDDLEQAIISMDTVYPVGITVLTSSGTDAPFDFGTWSVSGPDDFGNYMWQREE